MKKLIFFSLFLVGCYMFQGPYQYQEYIITNITYTIAASDGDFGDKIVINWNGKENIDKYYVLRSVDNVNYEKITPSGVTNTSYEDSTATSGLLYYYKVEYCFNDGKCEKSGYDTGFRGSINVTFTSGSYGEYYRGGDSFTITWSPTKSGEKVKIYLYDGSTKFFIATTNNNGSYTGNIPNNIESKSYSLIVENEIEPRLKGTDILEKVDLIYKYYNSITLSETPEGIDAKSNDYVFVGTQGYIRRYSKNLDSPNTLSNSGLKSALASYNSRLYHIGDFSSSTKISHRNFELLDSTLWSANNYTYLCDMTFDPSGNMYGTIYSGTSGKIIKLNSSGSEISSITDLSYPAGITSDSSFIYVAVSNEVRKYDFNLNHQGNIGSGFSDPYDIDIDNLGNFYITDRGSKSIKVFSPSGILIKAVFLDQGNSPYSFGSQEPQKISIYNNCVYVVLPPSKKIVRFDKQ